jgi:hypothetical protein
MTSRRTTVDDVNGTVDQAAEHPGDAYARKEIDAWYAQRLRFAELELRDATAWSIAALGGKGDKAQAARRLRETSAAMEEMESSFERWSTYGTMPPEHSERVSRVIGSIQGGLAAAFGPPITLTADETAALELGLDLSVAPDGQLAPALESALGLPASDPTRPPTAWQLANMEHHARWAVGRDAMVRLGLHCDGDPWTAEQHAKYARETAEGDADRVGSGWDPMGVDDVLESVQEAVGVPVTVGRDRLMAAYSSQDAARAHGELVHARLTEAAAEVIALVAGYEAHTAAEQLSPAARHTAGLVLADLKVTAERMQAAASASTGTYPKYLALVDKELRRAAGK